MPNFISEDQIEKAAVALLTGTYGYRAINCFTSDVENLTERTNRKQPSETC
jgi:type I restriction enzyme R subunit